MISPRLSVVRTPVSPFNAVQSTPTRTASAPVRAAPTPTASLTLAPPRPAAPAKPALPPQGEAGGMDAQKIFSAVMEMLQKLFSLFQGGGLGGLLGSGDGASQPTDSLGDGSSPAGASQPLSAASSPAVGNASSPATDSAASPVTSPAPAPAPSPGGY